MNRLESAIGATLICAVLLSLMWGLLEAFNWIRDTYSSATAIVVITSLAGLCLWASLYNSMRNTKDSSHD